MKYIIKPYWGKYLDSILQRFIDKANKEGREDIKVLAYNSYMELKEKPVWACGVLCEKHKKRKPVISKPVKGIVNTYNGKFMRTKENGETWANGVNVETRVYADTEEESKEIYNELLTVYLDILNEEKQFIERQFVG